MQLYQNSMHKVLSNKTIMMLNNNPAMLHFGYLHLSDNNVHFLCNVIQHSLHLYALLNM